MNPVLIIRPQFVKPFTRTKARRKPLPPEDRYAATQQTLEAQCHLTPRPPGAVIDG
jgi:hypothetical protein